MAFLAGELPEMDDECGRLVDSILNVHSCIKDGQELLCATDRNASWSLRPSVLRLILSVSFLASSRRALWPSPCCWPDCSTSQVCPHSTLLYCIDGVIQLEINIGRLDYYVYYQRTVAVSVVLTAVASSFLISFAAQYQALDDSSNLKTSEQESCFKCIDVLSFIQYEQNNLAWSSRVVLQMPLYLPKKGAVLFSSREKFQDSRKQVWLASFVEWHSLFPW